MKVNVINQKATDDFAIYHGDSVEVCKGLPENSVGFIGFSPPFSSLFTYSNSVRDMGNSVTDDEFFNHFNFMIKDLYRILEPGRNLVFHIQNTNLTKEHHGYIGTKDLRGDLIHLFEKAGFIFFTECVIWKDPLIEAVRTKNIKLAHKQVVKDSVMIGFGRNDFLIVMKKPGENKKPVAHKQGYLNWIGDERFDPLGKYDSEQRHNKLSHNRFQRYAGIWWDIRQTRTLETKEGRDKDDDKHIAPLQLDVCERLIEMYTNEGDIIFDPFVGIGTFAYQAILMNRKAIGSELKESYYKVAVKNCKKAVKIKNERSKNELQFV